MLLLIVAHRHKIRLIQQNIRRHQCRIGKQTAVNVFRVLGGFVLKLGHSAQLTEHGIAIQNPAQLRMLMYMALDKQGILLGIQSAGNILRKLLQSPATQVRRCLPHGDGMHICHKVKAFIGIRPGTPVFDSAQIVAQMQIAAGLDTGKHSLFCCNFFHDDPSFRDISLILPQAKEKRNEKLTLTPHI